jgi:hypothetical protein
VVILNGALRFNLSESVAVRYSTVTFLKMGSVPKSSIISKSLEVKSEKIACLSPTEAVW